MNCVCSHRPYCKVLPNVDRGPTLLWWWRTNTITGMSGPVSPLSHLIITEHLAWAWLAAREPILCWLQVLVKLTFKFSVNLQSRATTTNYQLLSRMLKLWDNSISQKSCQEGLNFKIRERAVVNWRLQVLFSLFSPPSVEKHCWQTEGEYIACINIGCWSFTDLSSKDTFLSFIVGETHLTSSKLLHFEETLL